MKLITLCFIGILLPICVFIWWFMFTISLLLAPKNSRTSYLQAKCALPEHNYTIFSPFRTPTSGKKDVIIIDDKMVICFKCEMIFTQNLWGRLANCLSLYISIDNF